MAGNQQYQITAKVWVYQGKGAWYFVTLPEAESEQIKFFMGHRSGGFGSIPVTATIGKTSWKTSIFPYKKAGGYILPLKAEIRKKEKIVEGGTVVVGLALAI